jgi:hypothetical protein
MNPELLDQVACQEGFAILVPMASTQALRKQLQAIPADAFTRRWTGFAAMKQGYQIRRGVQGP